MDVSKDAAAPVRHEGADERQAEVGGAERVGGHPPGIVIRDGSGAARQPRIAAFIWGGRVRPLPTLPYGRWKASPA